MTPPRWRDHELVWARVHQMASLRAPRPLVTALRAEELRFERGEHPGLETIQRPTSGTAQEAVQFRRQQGE